MQKRARVTRAAVIEGAASVFEEVGFGNASLRDVAERACVTKGALYFHFKSKKDLALAVIDEQHAMVEDAGDRAASGGLSALETIRSMSRIFGQQMLDEAIVRAGIRLTFEASAFDGDVKDPYRAWLNTVRVLAKQAQLENSLRSDIDVEDFARYLVSSFTGIQMVSSALNEQQNLLDRIDDMWAFIMPAITPVSA